MRFQSTHSLRSATLYSGNSSELPGVSIHALLAECDDNPTWKLLRLCSFNPRTPCGVRPTSAPNPEPTPEFQSTHSLRSATLPSLGKELHVLVSIHALLAECDDVIGINKLMLVVSIHALLAECDGLLKSLALHLCRFNPRTPCGVRLWIQGGRSPVIEFQSTHSLRSATDNPTWKLLRLCSFNPRTPCGVRRLRNRMQST